MVSSHAEKNFQGIILRISQSSAQLHPAHLGVYTTLISQHPPLPVLSKWGYRQRFREEQKPDAPFSFCGQVSSVTIGQMSMFIPLIAKGGRRESIAVYSDRRGVFSFTPRHLVVQWPDNLAPSRQISPFLAGAVTALSFLNFISLFWLHWVFIAVHRLSLVVSCLVSCK